MTHEDMPNGVVEHRIVEGERNAAGIAKEAIHTFPHKTFE